MTRRTIVGATLALIAAAAIPLGLPRVVSASGYDSIVFSPGPIAQAGALTTLSSVVDICVQPESGGAHVPGAVVWLSFDAGKFATAPTGGGIAMVGATALSSTPQSFTVAATCSFTGPVGSAKDGVQVVYTSPATAHTNGRDVITAADSAADSGSSGVCGGGVCNTDTYVFSPVMSYVFSDNPIAGAGTLTTGEVVTFTVTALDNSATPQPVPGAYLDLSLVSSGTGGSATAVNDISVPPSIRDLTNSPARVGAPTNSGSVSITYTAGNTTTATGMDTITAQDHPTATVSATTTYTYGATAAFSQAPYTPVAPFRVCDTRPAGGGITANQCDTGAGSGPLASGATRVVTIDTFGGVPASGVTAVVVNLTAVAPSRSTYLTVFPDGSAKPSTSNINPVAGDTVANLVEVGVSTAGKLDVYNAAGTGTTNIILDIEGYVSAASTGLFSPLAPARICDTRAAGGGIIANQCDSSVAHPIGSGGVLTFNVHTGDASIPATGVTAVVFNLTAISPTQATVLTAYGTSRPNASNLNLVAHATLPNRVIVPVSSTGTVSIWNGAGSVNVAVDVNGYFAASGPTAQFTALASPGRVCNTLDGNGSDAGCNKAPVGAGQALNINVTGIDGVPILGSAHSPVAVVINVTAINPSASTFVSVYPGLTPHPGVSDLNVLPGTVMTNLVVVEVGTDGTINLYNAAGSINLIVDVLGFYS